METLNIADTVQESGAVLPGNTRRDETHSSRNEGFCLEADGHDELSRSVSTSQQGTGGWEPERILSLTFTLYFSSKTEDQLTKDNFDDFNIY